MAERLYADRDVLALRQHYVKHVAAMTAEGLHAKSDIAAELAWRDAEIERLTRALRQGGEAVAWFSPTVAEVCWADAFLEKKPHDDGDWIPLYAPPGAQP